METPSEPELPPSLLPDNITNITVPVVHSSPSSLHLEPEFPTRWHDPFFPEDAPLLMTLPCSDPGAGGAPQGHLTSGLAAKGRAHRVPGRGVTGCTEGLSLLSGSPSLAGSPLSATLGPQNKEAGAHVGWGV